MSNSTKIYRIKLHASRVFRVIVDGFVRLGEFLGLFIFYFNIILDEALIKVVTKMRQVVIKIPDIAMEAEASLYAKISSLLIGIKFEAGAVIRTLEKFFATIRWKLEIHTSYILKLLFRVVIPMSLIGVAEFDARNYRRVFGWDRNLFNEPPTDYRIGDWDSPTIRIRDLDIAG